VGEGCRIWARYFAVTDPKKRAQGGITAFFVDADRPGYSVTRVQGTMSPFQHPVARALGLAQHLLDRSIEYAQSRIAFGEPIGKNQYVQGMIVDSFAELEQARLLVYQCAGGLDGGADGRRQAALAKLVATEMVGHVADRTIQVHGGNGFMTELGLEGWYRDVRAMRLYEGTSEILRTNVAKTLGLPG
jgi:alkylation response protein AidB-like acyl-CoA dehydrogenase